MPFNMRPDSSDPRVQQFLEEERRLREQERGGMMSGAPKPPPGGGPLGVMAGEMVQGNNPAGPAPMGPGGMAPPMAQRPAAPTNAAPGSAMGMQPRPDPYGRPSPAMGAPAFAPGAQLPMQAAAPTGAPAAASAAGTGAMASVAPWLAVAGQFMDQQAKQKAARQGAREQLQQNYAAQLGAPMAPIQAARAARDANAIEGNNYLAQLLPFFMQGRRA